MASQDARLSKFDADFKQQQSEMTNKIDIVLKAITDRITGALPSDTVKTPKLSTSSVLFARSYPIAKYLPRWKTSGLFTLPCRLGDSKPFDTLDDFGLCVNIIPLYLFKKHNIGLLEETDHIFRLADRTKSYPVGIVKDVEVHIGKLKLLNDLYVIDMKKDPETPLLIGRGFLATANAVIDRRMAKIAVGEGINRESYKPCPSLDGVGAQIPYSARKNFLDCHLPGEWEIARDAEISPFKDVLVFRRMVEFLGAIPINLKSNMWESIDLINNPINWNKPPKNRDEAWHAKIRLIDPGGEEAGWSAWVLGVVAALADDGFRVASIKRRCRGSIMTASGIGHGVSSSGRADLSGLE
ncbi:MAK10-like protein [Tanacetum coccineum]|uniref:MAK10-like protein n=1 Tax=Tanacetum coccineum TaxID=301880 RepID=A0ABQ5DH63_9ASTR